MNLPIWWFIWKWKSRVNLQFIPPLHPDADCAQFLGDFIIENFLDVIAHWQPNRSLQRNTELIGLILGGKFTHSLKSVILTKSEIVNRSQLLSFTHPPTQQDFLEQFPAYFRGWNLEAEIWYVDLTHKYKIIQGTIQCNTNILEYLTPNIRYSNTNTQFSIYIFDIRIWPGYFRRTNIFNIRIRPGC